MYIFTSDRKTFPHSDKIPDIFSKNFVSDRIPNCDANIYSFKITNKLNETLNLIRINFKFPQLSKKNNQYIFKNNNNKQTSKKLLILIVLFLFIERG